MIQQIQAQCEKCNGEGTVIAEKDRCKDCKGAKVAKEKKTLEVFVTKGMKHGDRIPFKGEADEAPNTIPGDVLVVLQQKDHPVFKRDGANLFMKKNITLQEALCGFNFKIHHLDGRLLKIKSDENVVYTPGMFKAIRDEGMPNVKNPYVKGTLYIEFEVTFPTPAGLPRRTREQLSKLLPGPTTNTDMETVPDSDPTHTEEVQLTDVNIEEERAKFEQQQRADATEEDEERPRAQQAGCRAQ